MDIKIKRRSISIDDYNGANKSEEKQSCDNKLRGNILESCDNKLKRPLSPVKEIKPKRQRSVSFCEE